ncbi:hypothetical protein EON80_18195 [bacterium]|nr:MAG: hypothetical protein EON80_18195 [bacterium]
MNDEHLAQPPAQSDYQPPPDSCACGALGCFLGAILGPALVYLGFCILAWLIPDGDPGGWLIILGVFVLSVPAGAVVGALLGANAAALLRFFRRR